MCVCKVYATDVKCHCSSEEWKKVPHKEREKLGLKVEDDGEFWSVNGVLYIT